MHRILNIRHPFFLPFYRRFLTVAFLAVWMLLELRTGNGGWALLVGSLAAYCFYEFHLVFDPANYEDKDG